MSLIETVREERAKFGTPLGYDGAGRVCNAVCLRHVEGGGGLVFKPTGTNWTHDGVGYSTDLIFNRLTGACVDILGSSETDGIPTWGVLSPEHTPSMDRWRPPIVMTPAPAPNPNPTPNLPPAESRLDRAITAFCRSWLGV